MTELRDSSHIISYTEGWQPNCRYNSMDVIYVLHLLCSNWLLILLATLVLTPISSAQHPSARHSMYKRQIQTSTPAGEEQNVVYKVRPKYLDQRTCINLTPDEAGSCNCTGRRAPPPIGQIEAKLGKLPWPRGTTNPPVTAPTVTTMTRVSVPPDTTRMVTEEEDILMSTVDTTTTESVSPTTTRSIPSTPPRDIDEFTPTFKWPAFTVAGDWGDSIVPTDSGEIDLDRGDYDDDSNEYHGGHKVPGDGITGDEATSGDQSGSGSYEEGRGGGGGGYYGSTGNPEESRSPMNSTGLAFSILIPLLIVIVVLVILFLYKTNRGQRGRYEIQRRFTAYASRGSQRSSSNANGSANNQQTDIEISGVTPETKTTNGGPPANSNVESEVTSDQDEGGNVNSKMLKNKPETPKSEAKNGKKLSLTPSLTPSIGKKLSMIPDEIRRSSRQLRLDSEALLMENTEGMSDDEFDLGNGHMDGDRINSVSEDNDDDAFGCVTEVDLVDVILEDGEDDQIRTNSKSEE